MAKSRRAGKRRGARFFINLGELWIWARVAELVGGRESYFEVTVRPKRRTRPLLAAEKLSRQRAALLPRSGRRGQRIFPPRLPATRSAAWALAVQGARRPTTRAAAGRTVSFPATNKLLILTSPQRANVRTLMIDEACLGSLSLLSSHRLGFFANRCPLERRCARFVLA